ncbi:MAG: M23 family metallopeptidase [Anaerofustis sp.]
MQKKKKRFEKAKHDYKLKYTIIIAPNTYGKTHKFSLSFFWVKNALFFIGLFFIAFVMLLISYIGLLSNYNQSKQDLLTLQSINKDQQVQLYDMNELAKEVDLKLQYLDLLQTKITNMIGDDTSNSDDPYMNEINAKLGELSDSMSANGGGNNAYMNYYIASTDINSFDISGDLDTIKQSLSEIAGSIDEQQSTYEALETDVEAHTDYVQCYPDYLPVHGIITDYFGYRTSPVVGFHNGVDIGAARGTPIQAAGRGTVILASWYSTFGNCVIIDHGYGYKTLYGHMSKILVSEGDTVEKGDVIGLVGSTGFSTGNHLHFGVMLNGTYVNPLDYITVTE